MRLFRLALPALLLLGTPACTPPVIHGRQMIHVFPDRKVQRLILAACMGSEAKVTQLVQEGADINARGWAGYTPLDWVIHTKRVEPVELLLKAGADPNRLGVNGWPPLTTAVHLKVPKLIDVLLKYKADPNGADAELLDHRPLDRAAFDRDFDLLKHLVRAGADINVHSADGSKSSAATTAIAMGRFDMVLWMLENGYNYDLPGLASHSVNCIVNSEGQPDKDRVLERLKAMGVPIPAPFKAKPL